MSAWLLALALFFLLLGLYPFGPYQLSLLLAERWRRGERGRADAAPAGLEEKPTFALLLSVYNEEKVIAAKIQNMLRLREKAGALDILVYVDGASDGTVQALEPYRDRIDLVVSEERRGKTHGMNTLVARSDASILIFTDANTRIDDDAIQGFARQFENRSIAAVCGTLHYTNGDEEGCAAVGSLYWRFNEWTKALESRAGSIMGADGALYAVRSALFEPTPEGLFDDLFLPLKLVADGHRVVAAKEARAFEAHTTDGADEFERKARIACECMHVHRTLWPLLRRTAPATRYRYLAYRYLRWMSGFSLAASALFAALVLIALFGWTIGLSLVLAPTLGFLLAWRAGVPGTASVANIIAAFAGVGLGVIRAIKGRRAITWELQQSARLTSELAS